MSGEDTDRLIRSLAGTQGKTHFKLLNACLSEHWFIQYHLSSSDFTSETYKAAC